MRGGVKGGGGTSGGGGSEGGGSEGGGSEGGGGDKWGWGEIIHEAEAIQVDKNKKKTYKS
jgi:hypothetical protein